MISKNDNTAKSKSLGKFQEQHYGGEMNMVCTSKMIWSLSQVIFTRKVNQVCSSKGPPIGEQTSTNRRTNVHQSANKRPPIGEQSAKIRRAIGEQTSPNRRAKVHQSARKRPVNRLANVHQTSTWTIVRRFLFADIWACSLTSLRISSTNVRRYS